jgi:hypothetical protein
MLSSEITEALGCVPSIRNDVGAQRTAPNGQHLEGVYGQTYWVHKFETPSGREIEECIVDVLNAFGPKREFLYRLRSTGGRAELFIGVFLEKNAGIELDQTLIQQVADAGLGLSFDLYVPGA